MACVASAKGKGKREDRKMKDGGPSSFFPSLLRLLRRLILKGILYLLNSSESKYETLVCSTSAAGRLEIMK